MSEGETLSVHTEVYMTKKEFLDVLTESLAGNIPAETIEENIIYYKDYIERSDKSEKDTINELGDPHLIARTIIDSFIASKGPMAEYYKEQARSEYSSSQGNFRNMDYNDIDDTFDNAGSGFSLKWYEKLMGVVIIVAVVAMLLVLGAVAVKIIIRIVLPIVIVLLVIKLIVDHFGKDS